MEPQVRLLRAVIVCLSALPILASCATAGRVSSPREKLSQLESGGTLEESYVVLGYRYRAQTKSVRVPERRGSASSVELTIPVMTWKALHPDGSPPLFVFHGGPGIRNLSLGFDALLAERRDIVLVGYRGLDGTRRVSDGPGYKAAASRFSAAPSPETYEDLKRSLASSAADLERGGIDLAGYSLVEVADDIEAARLAAGYGAIDLFGTSFGSRVAETYAARYPSSTRRVVAFLSGAPLDYYGEPGSFLLSLDRAAIRAGLSQGALSPIVERLAGSSSGRFKLAALHGTLGTADSGDSAVKSLQAFAGGKTDALDSILRGYGSDFTRSDRSMLIRLLMLGSLPALAGDGSDFVNASKDEIVARPLYALESDLVRATRSAAGLAADPGMPFGSFDGPTLILEGALDPFDPPDRARDALLPLYPQGKLVVFDGDAHEQPPSASFWALIDRFLATGEVDTSLLAPSSFEEYPR